jgi:hypothetical protein
MTLAKTSLACILCAASLLAGTFAFAEAPCKEPVTGTKDVPILSPPTANTVTGKGRLQFYSAPNLRCPMNGVFVIPTDELIVYAETRDGWSSVMYANPKTGNNVSGWVRSARLREAGTVAPKQ